MGKTIKNEVKIGGEVGVPLDEDNLPCQEILFQLFELGETNGELDGRLFHKWRDRKWFDTDAVWKMWNAKMAGQPALSAFDKDGRGRGTVLNRRSLIHQVIYKMVHGGICPDLIDHMDGNPANNRPDNLRAATHVINHRNRKRNTNNRSGVTGVTWNKADKVWKVVIGVGEKKNKYLGRFATLEEAVAVRKAAEKEYGYSERHGSDSENAQPPAKD